MTCFSCTNLVSLVNILSNTSLEHATYEHGVRLVAHLEHVLGADVREALRRGLQVVQSGAQVALCRKHYGIHALLCVRQLLLFTDLNHLENNKK